MPKLWSDLGRANERMQHTLNRNESIIAASYGMLGSLLGFGVAGYATDRTLATSPVFLVTGLLSGMAVGFYFLIRTART
jgi:F0F1-type ATP synthase assembly protein I